MLAIISPAKNMKVLPENEWGTQIFTQPDFIDNAAEIISELQKLEVDELSSLLKINNKLAIQNNDRYHNWNKKHSSENSMQAVFAFTGEVYRGIKVNDFADDDLSYLQNMLRILSAVYGVIKPLDLIQEYRMEMGLNYTVLGAKNFYAFWKQTITDTLNEAVEKSSGSKVLINLASKEYSSVIDERKFKFPVIEPVFYQENEGKLKMIVVYAKRARGMMARFIVENRLKNADDLKAFDCEGYYYDNARSTELRWVFVR